MSLHPLFVAVLVVLIGLAIWTATKSRDQLALLQQQGFEISHDLNGNPKLLVDEAKRQLAVVHHKGFERLDFDRIRDIELAFDSAVQNDTNFRIELFSDQLAYDMIAVGYENEWRARQEFARLKELLGR
ncbi:hypothetical protein [Marinobacterium arenosum]|uniref:hypothetical protein n=1 Tax=Marinobacterium arenosum TaxID=2862496 RepID=UPI001C9524A8|nr:hypothetical protein [Marinobacterium arenosum]MBY4678816.1 hypothetical protein [Marinobacterium arenosum]